MFKYYDDVEFNLERILIVANDGVCIQVFQRCFSSECKTRANNTVCACR